MQSATAGLKNIVLEKLFHQIDDLCPRCQAPLMECNKVAAGTNEKVKMCGQCYWPTKASNLEEQKSTNKETQKAIRNDAINYLFNHSVLSNGAMLKNTFDNYQVNTEEEKEIKQKALATAFEFGRRQGQKVYITGAVGTGKSHLASAILWETLEQRNNTINNQPYKTLALQWTQYLDIYENSKRDYNAVEKLKNIDFAIKKADLILIDDLGAEVVFETPKEISRRLFTNLLDVSSDKNLIITSNLKTENVRSLYGERVYSRLKSNLTGFVTEGITDHRG